VFDEVMKQEGGKRAARKGAYILGSTAFQVLLVAGLIVASTAIRAATQADQLVDVKFIRAAPPPPPPPPPPAHKKSAPKPKSDAPKPTPPSPTAMIQPKDVPQEMKPPDPSEKKEEPDYGDEGSEGGVVGGVVGAGQIEEAPQYMQAGFRKPVEAQPGCIRNSIRIPPALQGFISGPITVKMGIRPDGTVQALQLMTPVPDKRIEDAIRNAAAQCPWIPGADAQGRPIRIWVIMPIRFTGG